MGIYKYVDETYTKVEEVESLQIWIDKHGPTYLYYLCEPRGLGSSLRYVGIARDPIQRYEKHLSLACNKSSTTHDRWIRWLHEQGAHPHMVIRALYQKRREACQAEQDTIKRLRASGFLLVNAGLNIEMDDVE